VICYQLRLSPLDYHSSVAFLPQQSPEMAEAGEYRAEDTDRRFRRRGNEEEEEVEVKVSEFYSTLK